MDTLTIIAMTAAAYVATNIDNLLLLIAFYSRYLPQSRLVTAGYADRKSTRLNSSHSQQSRMPSSA